MPLIPTKEAAELLTEHHSHVNILQYITFVTWPNPNHIFELFGQLSGHSASNVRFLLLSDIAADVQFYQRTSFVCLEMRNTSFNQWITNLSLEEMYADELTLFLLSWLYKQHTVVITKNKLWSTLHSNSPVNEEALLDVCSVKLVYLGQL